MSLILSGSDGLSDVDGSASTPAIRGTDANTGIFFPAADTIAFAEGGAEVMRIDSSGNVGIGTTSPTSFGASYKILQLTAGSSSGGGGYYLSTNGTTTTQLGTDGVSGFIGTRTAHPVAFTTDNSERARIDSSGNLLVGTTSIPSTGAGTNSTIVSNKDYSSSFAQIINSSSTSGTQSFIQFGRGSSECGKITSTATNSTTYATSSDYRLKENVAPLTGALSRIAALKPVTYQWKSDGTSSEGFIAHELAEVVPQAVVGDKDAVYEDGSINPQGIDTSFLVATLTAAIQELKAELDAAKARIAVLEAK